MRVNVMRQLAIGAGVVLVATVGAAADFTLREHLGYGWSNECVGFPLSAEQLKIARQGKALRGPDGREIAYQLAESGGGVTRICFQADLSPYNVNAYEFTGAGAKPQTDLEVTETAESVKITNKRIGIEIRKRLQPGQGPIARLRLGSGTWTGGSTLEGGAAIADYKVAIEARGPVFAEALCTVAFADGGRWTLRFRVERAEPVVRVDEQFDAPGGGVCRLALGGGTFKPTLMLNRDSRAESASVRSDPIGNYFLEPWLHWNNGGHGNWIALFTPTPMAPAATVAAGKGEERDKDLEEFESEVKAGSRPVEKAIQPLDDMLVAAVLKPSLWVDPKWSGRAKQCGANVQATVRDGSVNLDLPVQGGRRVWLLGALDKTRSAEILMAKERRVAPPPQKLVIKHGDFPLDTVKDYVLDWPGDEENHPRLHIRKQDLPALKARLKSNPVELNRWTTQQPVDKYLLDGPIREFIASGDPKLGKLMAAKAEEYLQTCVDWYYKQDYLHCPGTAPHMQSLIVTVLNLIDPVLSTEAFTPEARKRVLAKLAFMGYVVSSMDYWSPERGFSGFANMTSIVALYRAGLGCMLPAHPQGKVWAEQGLGQLSWQLKAWSDEDGGWLEAPHYAMVSLDHMIAGFTMAANAGFADYAFDPRMRKVYEWFATISTPRDSRTGGFRHQPPIGNTYHGEPSGICGIAAALWKERDPDFAARMQWLFEQGGAFGNLGIGWNFPSGLGYRFLLKDSGVAAKPANFGSAWFRRTGVVLRNTMQSDRETYLHMIAGSNHDHYDLDSGGIIVYGKGRALADDWGYIGRHGDRWHSMLTSQDAWGGSELYVATFSTTPALDYVSGKKGAWQREIFFLKDADPLGPNYFVIRDTHASDAPAQWRLWLAPRTPGAVDKSAEIIAQAAAARSDVSATRSAGNDGKEFEDLLVKPKAAPPKPYCPVSVHGQGATVSGFEDVAMDIFIREAAKLNLATEEGVQSGSCGYRDGREGPYQLAQTALIGNLAGRGTITALLYPRLKAEPAPKVTWSEDGTVVQIETATGADTVFLATQKRQRVVSGGKALIPLPSYDPVYECAAHAAGPSGPPWILVNASDKPVKNEAFVFTPRSVAVHPGFPDPITVVWQSPVDGTISMEANVRDADPGVNSQVPEKSDGVIGELRKGKQTLARAVVADGGPGEKLAASGIAVAKGDLVRLVILPGPCNWFDSILIDMRVRDAAGSQWVLSESLLKGDKLGNDLAGEPLSAAVWWACEGDAEAFNPRAIGAALVPLSDVEKTAESLHFKAEGANTPFLNIDRSRVGPAADVSKLPPDFITVHPAPVHPVTVVWRSPVAGTVSVEARVADGDPGTNEKDGWRSDGILYELRKDAALLGKGAIPNGGAEVKVAADKVDVAKGDLVRLLILPGPSEWWDTTRVEMVVQDAGGKKWSMREALMRGEKLGNEIGADPAKAIWWVCEGDAARFEEVVLNPPPEKAIVSPDGKVRLQGTIGAVQNRGSKVTLTLGARGIIRAGNKELASDVATSRSETR